MTSADTSSPAARAHKPSSLGKHGVRDAALAMRVDIERIYPPPPATTGVFARAVPHDRVVPENREGRALRHLADEIVGKSEAVERLHAETGARIDAWQELPKDSAVAVAEARSIASLVDQEIAAIEALRSALSRALHAAKGDELSGARRRLEALKEEVDRWHRDAQADRHELLVHGGAVKGATEGNALAPNAPAASVPLPARAQRAMADAIERRRGAEGNDEVIRTLVSEEQRIQLELEKQLGSAIDAAREAMVSEGVHELRAAFDAVRAWGHSLAFEARRFKRPS